MLLIRHENQRNIGIGIVYIVSWVLLAALPATVLAQQPLPKSADPGQIEKRFEEPTQPKATFEGEIEVPERKGLEIPAGAEKKLFTLTGIVVEGATVFTDADFLPLYEKYLNQTVSLADVYKIAEAITAKYGNAGYILSRAFVPPQTIKNGIVRILVVEGFIDKVHIEGSVEGRRHLLEAYSDKIVASRPLKAEALERYLLLIDDLPGVTVQSVLKPSAEQVGAATLTIVLEHKKYEGSISLDNRGTENVGPYQGLFALGLNSAFGLYEKTLFRFAGTSEIEELQYYQITHVEMVGSEGLQLNFTGKFSHAEPGGTLLDVDIESENLSLSLQASYPIIRLRRKNLSVHAGFTYRNAQTDLFSEKFTEDRLRIAKAGLTFDLADSNQGVNQVEFEVSQGLNILNETTTGSDNLTRPEGHSDFTKLTLDLSRVQKLPSNFSIVAAASGQWAGEKLLSSEEFGVGGAKFGRGHDPSEITGDRGFAGLVELRYTFAPNIPHIDKIQPYGYCDYGQVHQINTGHEELASAGLGIRFNCKYLSGSLEVAKPLTHDVAAEGDKDARIFFSLAGRF